MCCEGGAIGVRATGDIAKAVMVDWDKKLNEKLEKLITRPLMYKRYVNDQNLMIEVVKPGARFDAATGEMIQEDDGDDARSSEDRTVETVREIGNSTHTFTLDIDRIGLVRKCYGGYGFILDPMIQLTSDYPERNENGRVSILDLECWLARDKDCFQQIMYSFYKKPMKSPYVMMMKSAVPMRTKRNALTQEVKRRLCNCHKYVSYKFRQQVIDAGVKA